MTKMPECYFYSKFGKRNGVSMSVIGIVYKKRIVLPSNWQI